MSKKEISTPFSTLFIKPEALQRIFYYTDAADGEVSGLGIVVRDENQNLLVDKIFLLEQESSAGDTEIDPAAISKLMTDMVKSGADPGQLKFWWHSHGNMGCFWSSTDDECAEKLSKEFAFSLVVNKSRERRCRLDLYNPFRLTIDNIKLRQLTREDTQLKEECEKEVKEKVRSPKYYYQGRGYGGVRDWYDKDYNQFGSKVRLKQRDVNDIKRYMEVAERLIYLGGTISEITLHEYIRETLKSIIQARFDRKGSCSSFGNWDDITSLCDKCRVSKICKHWTNRWEKEDEQAIERIDSIKEKNGGSKSGVEYI